MTVRTFLDGKVTLHASDCRDVMRALPDESVDAVVTDPPYALVSIVKRFGKLGSAATKDGDVYSRSSAGFMGKQWDTGEAAFAVEFWEQVLRVLKPGGHVVAFSGTRTYHRLACAIEDAGFEIRDQIGWAFGSGFPKSHDVSKGIDKKRGEDIEPIRGVCRFLRAAMDGKNLKSRHLTQHFNDCNPRLIDHWAARDSDSQPCLPTWAQWQKLKEVLAFGEEMDVEVWRLNGRKGKPGDAWMAAEVLGHYQGEPGGFGDHRFNVRDTAIRAPACDASKQWQGWGTALKPAWEPICLARKPLIGTIAENVLTHGTGALNIDGCRVEADARPLRELDAKPTASNVYAGRTGDGGLGKGLDGGSKAVGTTDLGRWPANLVHDGSDEVLACFPYAPGQLADVAVGAPSARTGNVYGKMNRHGEKSADRRYADNGGTNFAALPGIRRGDTGSSARFFYQAKADSEDRLGSKHPTVKPIDLMQWLVRLVCPKGGTVIDPFAGTGTTGEAAWREGCKAILIEREEEYQADIARRMELAANPTKRAAVAATKNNLDKPEDLPLFAKAIK